VASRAAAAASTASTGKTLGRPRTPKRNVKELTPGLPVDTPVIFVPRQAKGNETIGELKKALKE
jgi:hypothetical protein